MTPLHLALVAVAAVAPALTAAASDPWVITTPVEVTSPLGVGDVIVASGGRLVVRDLPEPGLRVSGNLVALGDGEIRLERSVIQFMSVYNGQYALAALEQGRVTVDGCDYRVPSGVQHALFAAGDAVAVVTDSDFGDMQLLAADRALLTADRLDGRFEVLLQHDARIELADIPRTPGGGELWLWPEIPAGAELVFSPPRPGFVASWSFPPPDAVGIRQSAVMERCQVLLWPLLVREGCRLTLRDIPEASWVVVGLHLPRSLAITGLVNGSSATGEPVRVPVADRTILLENASVDTWNLYPQGRARVRVVDSHLGEVLTMEHGIALLERTLVDGSGGFVGARDSSLIVADRCTFTCTVEAAHDATIRLHGSVVEPYPVDPTGQWTRFGAYDRGRLLADQTPVLTRPELAGQGLIAVTFLVDPPPQPPPPGAPVTLHGTAAQYSLDPEVAPGRWRLEAVPAHSRHPRLLASGDGNVEEGTLATWEGADPTHNYQLRLVLVDGWGRTLVGRQRVPGTGFP